jgi:hypothetical protein
MPSDAGRAMGNITPHGRGLCGRYYRDQNRISDCDFPTFLFVPSSVLIIISASTEMLVGVVALRPPHPAATANVLQGHDSQFQPESQSQPPPPAEQQPPPPPDDAGPRQPSEPTAAEPQPDEHSVDHSGRTQWGNDAHEVGGGGGGDDGACTSASIEELISRCEHRQLLQRRGIVVAVTFHCYCLAA